MLWRFQIMFCSPEYRCAVCFSKQLTCLASGRTVSLPGGLRPVASPPLSPLWRVPCVVWQPVRDDAYTPEVGKISTCCHLNCVGWGTHLKVQKICKLPQTFNFHCPLPLGPSACICSLAGSQRCVEICVLSQSFCGFLAPRCPPLASGCSATWYQVHTFSW